jgi:DNA-binding SARP family transcriptional activator
MRVRVLGPVEVRNDDGAAVVIGQRKTSELLFVLAVTGGPVSSEQLRSMLWEPAGMHDVMSALTSTVDRLRMLLSADRLVGDEDGYRLVLDLERDHLDVREFRDLVAAARGVRESDPLRALELFQQAIELWREPALPDLPGTPAVRACAERLLTERKDAIEALVEVRMALGWHAELALDLPELLAEDPLNERLWLALLLALYRDGSKDAALEAYEEARTSYLTEVGTEPSRPLQDVRDRITADAPGLAWSADQTVRESRAIIAGADATAVAPARVYDYLLGGDNNFEVDRVAAEAMLATVPDLRVGAHDNRRFLCRAVRLLAERGIRQFVDIGAGLPTSRSVHEVARDTDPEARVLYVDHDPMVVAHGRAMIDDSRYTAYVLGDLRKPAEIFADSQTRRLIDRAEPTAVLMLQVLHLIPADAAYEALEAFRSWMAPGSALVMSHVTRDGSDPEAIKAIQEMAELSSLPTFVRSRDEIEAMFAGLELLAPLNDPANCLATERAPDRGLRGLAGVAILAS